MKTREEALSALVTKRDNYKRFVKKINVDQRKKINTFMIRIRAIESCIRDLENGSTFEIKDGFVSTVSAKVKLVGE